MNPIIKWVGGKRKLLPIIKQYIPEYNKYHEPFLGGGALAFDLMPIEAVLSDLNEDLMRVYHVVKYDVYGLLERLEFLKYNFEASSNKAAFYYLERKYYQTQNVIYDAASFIFLNKTSFNGLYRVNSKGKYNSPFGKHETFNYDEDGILKLSKYFNANRIELMTCSLFTDYRKSKIKKDDFVYFDPPYSPSSKTANFTGYTIEGFSDIGQNILCDLFYELTHKGVKCMLSNSDTMLIRELYKNFNIVELNAARSINSKGDKRGKVGELLVMNY